MNKLHVRLATVIAAGVTSATAYATNNMMTNGTATSFTGDCNTGNTCFTVNNQTGSGTSAAIAGNSNAGYAVVGEVDAGAYCGVQGESASSNTESGQTIG